MFHLLFIDFVRAEWRLMLVTSHALSRRSPVHRDGKLGSDKEALDSYLSNAVEGVK